MPKDVRALVVLNFQSYSGGKDIWGLHDHQWPDEKAKGLKKPIFDDNCIEVSPRHSPSPHSPNLTVSSLTIPLQCCGVPANSSFDVQPLWARSRWRPSMHGIGITESCAPGQSHSCCGWHLQNC